MFFPEQKQIINKYKKYYKSIGSIKCSYFDNEEIIFNKIGFNHLIRKGGEFRSFKDQMRRLVLLKYSVEILQGNYVEVEFRSNKELKNAYFWCFKTRINGKYMKLIIRQIELGRKYFFDIFPVKH